MVFSLNLDINKCYHADDRGASYVGSKNTTAKGENCLRWDTVGFSEFAYIDKYYGFNFEHNYCRYPGTDIYDLHVSTLGTIKTPGCFIDKETVKECGVPKCGMETIFFRYFDHSKL